MRIVHLCITLLIGLVALPQDAHAQPPGQNTTPEEYIALWKEVAKEKMAAHGIPASITLAQGLLESRNGNSVLASEGNNHFGIKCTPDWTGGKMYHDDDKKDDCFRKYKSAEQSFEDHSKFLQRPRYASLFELKPTDYKGWAHGLKKCGYATDPQYPNKLINLVERYELDKLDRGIDVHYAKAEKPTPATSTSKKPTARKRGNDQANVVTLTNGRNEERFEGRIKFVRAKKGDTIKRIADDVELMPGVVAGWNDVAKDAQLEEGQVIYLSPKRNKSKTTELHIAEEGETLWGVSQRYGVKLRKLAEYNSMGIADPLKPGQKVMLRKPRK